MNIELYNELCKLVSGDRIFQNEPMKQHTTFRTGGPADILVQPAAEELAYVIELCKKYNEPWIVIGNGSNLLVSDAGIPGVVIELGKYQSEIVILDDVVVAQAGALLSAVANKAAEEELTGLEFAAGIPGTVGGAVVMNAGAYGGEMKDVMVQAAVLTPEGDVVKMTPEQLELSYRHSNISERGYIVLAAKFKLAHADAKDIYGKMNELKEQRVTKQPLEYPSAGSTFKRPEGHFAGKLIQDANLRGYQLGGAQVSEKHCGFVINAGGATSTDIATLIKVVQKKVKETFGVDLETEVKFVGDFE